MKKILIIDDDAIIGEMLQMLLDMNGFDAKVSNQPQKAVQNIRDKNIDLVILDKLISGVNGTEVCQTIRKDETVGHVPILMMSALHDAGPDCKAAGANDFIAKPFEMQDLLAKINGLMGN